MEISTKTYRESVYQIIDQLKQSGRSKSVFEDTSNREKAEIYGGESCLEISPLTNIIENPLELFPVIPGRGNHLIMQIAEVIWVLNGKTNISEFFGQFASPSVQKFSHNTDDLYAAYGYRIRNQPEGNDVLRYIIDTLSKKITSRSAVFPIFSAELDTMGGKHKPCATTFQLHYFDNKLDGILTLRANDLIKGYTAINYIEFAFLQIVVSYILNVEVGRFINFTSTMHYYLGDASARVENILRFKDVNLPGQTLSIKNMFDYSVKQEDRLASVLEDVEKIYSTLSSNNTGSQHHNSFNHSIFESFYTILFAYKNKTNINDFLFKLPGEFTYSVLENYHRNFASEVETLIEKHEKFQQFSQAILWRNNLERNN